MRNSTRSAICICLLPLAVLTGAEAATADTPSGWSSTDQSDVTLDGWTATDASGTHLPAAGQRSGAVRRAPGHQGTPSGAGRHTARQRPGTGNRVHVVKPGETLSGIAAEHGRSWRALARENGITDPNVIYVGQQVRY